MKQIWILLIILVAGSLFSHNYSLISDTDNAAIIRFQLPAYELLTDKDGTRIVLADKPDAYGFTNLGAPDIPSFADLLIVPAGMRLDLSWRVSKSSTINDVYIVPSRDMSQVEKGDLSYTANPKLYHNANLNPQLVSVNSVDILRQYAVAKLVAEPFVYDDAISTLTVNHEIEIQINFVPDSTIPRPQTNIKTSRDYAQYIRSVVINPARVELIIEDFAGHYLFLMNPSLEENASVLAFLDWKRQKGFLVSTYYSNENQYEVLEYLENLYQNSDYPPEYICIIGDAEASNMSFPTCFYFSGATSMPVASDFPYSLLSGADILPEASVGRISVEDVTTLTSVLAKIKRYERWPSVASDSWRSNDLLVGDDSQSGISTILTVEAVASLINEKHPDNDAVFVTYEPFLAQVDNAMSNGVGSFWYRGFAGSSGINVDDIIYNILNTNKTPYAICITCHTGVFSGGVVSLAEAFLRAGSESPSAGGGIAAIGSSSETHTCTNNIITGGIAWGIYRENLPNMGLALNRGKYSLLENYPDNDFAYEEWYAHSMNLMGDPGMQLATTECQEILLDYSGALSLGSHNIEVLCTDVDGNALGDARITAYLADEIFASGLTNENGVVRLLFTANVTGTLAITATKQNFHCVTESINIFDTSTILNIRDVIGTDIICGIWETFEVSLENNGPAITVDGIISNSAWLDSISISPDIFIHGEFVGILPSEINIKVAANCPNNEAVDFSLLAGGEVCGSARILINNYQLELAAIVDSYSVIMPGNLITLQPVIYNGGQAEFASSVGVLSTDSDYLSFTGSLSYDSIEEDTSALASRPVIMQVSFDCPVYANLPVYLDLVDALGRNVRLSTNILTGERGESAGTGPDNYGYLAYSQDDTAFPAEFTYDWLEISPFLLGDGDEVELADYFPTGGGDFSSIELPFAFTYYGQVYQNLTICSNGFVMPGVAGSLEWMNRRIPGPMVPNRIIAPFWDDLLIPPDGDVSTYHDELNNTYIVEWNSLVNRYDQTSRETFQLIIYDSWHYPTLSGDAIIKFQYKEFNNIDMGSYGGAYVNHGEYASIGIANHDNSDGLEYSFANIYPSTASPLTNESVLVFQPSSLATSVIYLPSIYDIDNTNGNAYYEAGEVISYYLRCENNTDAVIDDINLTLSLGEETQNDDYVSIINGSISFGLIAANSFVESATPVTISISEDCPKNYSARLRFNYASAQGNVSVGTAIKISGPELKFTSHTVSDGNDNQVEAGESGNIFVRMHKDNPLNYGTAQFSLSSDYDLFILDTPIINRADDDSLNFVVNFPFTYHQDALNGQEINFECQVSYGLDSTEMMEFSYYAGHPAEIITSDFGDNHLAGDWAIVPPVTNSSLAGGTAPEIYLDSRHSNEDLLKTINIPSNSCPFFLISFKSQKIETEANNAHIELMYTYTYNHMQNSVTVWNNQDPSVSTQNIAFVVPEYNYGEGNFRFHWYIEYMREGDTKFYIDDVVIKGIMPDKGSISGDIIAIGGEQLDYSRVQISDGVKTFHPDSAGHFSNEMYPGAYNILFNLPEYFPKRYPDFVISSRVDEYLLVQLEKIPAPVNLEMTRTHSSLDFTWNYPHMEHEFFSHYVINRYLTTTSGQIVTYQTGVSSNSYHFSPPPLDWHWEFEVMAMFNWGGTSPCSERVSIDWYVGTDDEVSKQPNHFMLHQNYPNPFYLGNANRSSETIITYELATDTNVCRLDIYNIKGALLKSLTNCPKNAGVHSLTWDGKDGSNRSVATGVYLYRLTTDSDVQVRKAILMK